MNVNLAIESSLVNIYTTHETALNVSKVNQFKSSIVPLF